MYLCNSASSKMDTRKTCGSIVDIFYWSVLPVKDPFYTIDLDPGGICGLQSVLLTVIYLKDNRQPAI